MSDVLLLDRSGAAPLADLPLRSVGEFRQCILSEVAAGARISSLFGCEPWTRPGRRVALVAVLSRDAGHEIVLLATEVEGSWPALTPDCTQAHLFEREIAEQWDLVPEGHPWLKPVRWEASRRAGRTGRAGGTERQVVGVTGFFRIEGEEVHEVAVGPVHAGVIEPGHFRFQCHGETVYHLEISLGYQHRGLERALEGAPGPAWFPIVETIAGDTTVGHATAWCRALEQLSGREAPTRVEQVRALGLELERLANHIGDLGALAGDVGFLPTASYCGRIRGDVLNMTALVCGSRFGRCLVRPGVTGFEVDRSMSAELRGRLPEVMRDARGAVDLLWARPAILDRFEGTGPLSGKRALEIGLVGPAARACGLARDARVDHPAGWYRGQGVAAQLAEGGDVLGRARVRWLEAESSAAIVTRILEELDRAVPGEPGAGSIPPLRPRSISVSLVEGWRGEICHTLLTDRSGRVSRCKLVDPSFHNWFGLACSLRGQQISDFPLANKSFNLSYCGFDL